ncbi:hypothetical protein [Salinicola rhizosphaerae]|uniref:Uncharacterized protein n=1 Tax=Salinicola rhizosphaerae TaxID=1443141 RepID=A0ABQ3DUZ1_9GAMM|nr:hypothetical protein [Salinicola rhizosphaerae]GHB17221.1 hypothetical protein GCM10009038_14940 [Salinicola rhizosphaerae]
MAIDFDLWIDPDDHDRHRSMASALERYFMERLADYPHLRLPGPDPYDYDAPFNRLQTALVERARDFCLREHAYSPTPMQLSQAFYRAVARSNKVILDSPHGDSSPSGAD